jgi:thioesterase domain-containing protein
MQTKGSLPPFYCVAGMGGTLNNLRKLALLVGDARPFYGLQPPGAEDSSQRLWRVEELAEHYIREVRAVQPQGPYLLGGYSGGGTVAFEMSKQLSAVGEAIAFLGFIDSYSPDLPRRSATERAKVHLRRAQMEGPNYFLRMLKHRVIYEKLVMQERVTKQLARVFPDKYRYENIADSWKVAEGAYHPGPWPGGRAVLFRAREESAIGLWTGVVVDELHGWGRYLPGGVELQITPGNHATMCEDPHVRALASKMRDAMDRASPPVAAGAALAPSATL